MTELRTDLVVRRFGRPPAARTPTLLLLHGLTGSSEAWPEAVAHWQDDYAIVAVDARGHGGSPRFTDQQLDAGPGDVMVEDSVRVLEQLDRPVVIGHSLGGAVALTAGVLRPELVRGLVLEDPALLGPDEPRRARTRGEELVRSIEPSLAASDERSLLEARRRDHPEWQEAELLASGRSEQQVDVDYLARGDLKPSSRWPELFERLRVRTLVVSGDQEGQVCVDRPMELGLAGLGDPRVTLERVPGAGHCIRRERPDSFYRIVDEWLGGVDWT